MSVLVRVRQSRAIHVACALLIWLKTSVCTLSNLTSLLCPHLHSAQTHLHSAGNFSKELVVHPHHSMALLMGRFFPAKMSTKCGGKHSSSSLVLPVLYCRLKFQALQCDASSQCLSHSWLEAASGMSRFLLAKTLQHHGGYSCLAGSMNLDSRGTGSPLQPAPAQLLVDCWHPCQQLGPINACFSCCLSCYPA